MGRAYSIYAKNATVIASGTLVSVRPVAAGNGISLIRGWVDFSGTATSAQEALQIALQPTAFSTLTGFVPIALDQSDPASGIGSGTAQTAGTSGHTSSAEGGGTKVPIIAGAFNVLNGWLWVGTPSQIITSTSGSTSALVINFTGTPSVLTNWTYGLNFEEV